MPCTPPRSTSTTPRSTQHSTTAACYTNADTTDLDVPAYLAGLRAVRQVERALEPLRDQPHTRAYELSTAERQEPV